jgi:hypothetical protein
MGKSQNCATYFLHVFLEEVLRLREPPLAMHAHCDTKPLTYKALLALTELSSIIAKLQTHRPSRASASRILPVRFDCDQTAGAACSSCDAMFQARSSSIRLVGRSAMHSRTYYR